MVEEKITLIFFGIDNTDIDEMDNDDDDDDDDSFSDFYPTNSADTSTDDIRRKGKNEQTTTMVLSLSNEAQEEKEQLQTSILWTNCY